MTRFDIEYVEDGKVKVVATVSAEDVKGAFELARKEVDRLKERPLSEKQQGDDPEKMIENAIETRATRMISEKAIKDAIAQQQLRVTSNPSVEIAELAKSDQAFTFDFTLDIVPEYALSDHADMHVVIEGIGTITDEDVDDKLQEIRLRSATPERGSKEPLSGFDIAKISFSSTIDGEEYEGSSAQGFAYQLGSHMMPQGFEDGLAGMRAGETKTIEFVVDEDFENQEIAGKAARFDIAVDEATHLRLPDLDDEFAKEFGYESLAAFRETLRGRIKTEREAQMETIQEKALREELAKHLIGEIPPNMIASQAQRMLDAFKQELRQQNISFDEYCSALGLTRSDVMDGMTEEATSRIREDLALESLFRELDLKVSEDDLRQTAADVALESGLSIDLPYESLSPEQKQAIREMTMHRLATEWLLENVDCQCI